MTPAEKIVDLLTREFAPLHLEILDSSDKHAGHAGAKEFGGGHYSVLVVSAAFAGKTPVERHRLVNTALRDLFGRDIHALALRTLSPDEWQP